MSRKFFKKIETVLAQSYCDLSAVFDESATMENVLKGTNFTSRRFMKKFSRRSLHSASTIWTQSLHSRLN